MENNLLNIRVLRKKLNITQRELAEKCGVHWRTIQNWENDPSSIPYVKAQYISTLFKDKCTESTDNTNIFQTTDGTPCVKGGLLLEDSTASFSQKDVSFSGNVNSQIKNANITYTPTELTLALQEIAEQRKLTQKSQEQIDRLLSLLEAKERKE